MGNALADSKVPPIFLEQLHLSFFFCKDSKLHVNLIKTISWMYESYSKKLSYEATDDNKKNEKCSLVKKLTSLLDDEYHSLGTHRSPVK